MILFRLVPESNLLKRAASSTSQSSASKPASSPTSKPVSLLKISEPKKPVNLLIKTETSLLKSNHDLPSSITLTPALPSLTPAPGLFKKSSLSIKPDPKMIEEVNNSWAESLMSKSKRPRDSSPTYPGTVQRESEYPTFKLLNKCSG